MHISFWAELLVLDFVVPFATSFVVGGVLVGFSEVVDEAFFLLNFHDALIEWGVWTVVEVTFVGYHADDFWASWNEGFGLKFEERTDVLGSEDENLWFTEFSGILLGIRLITFILIGLQELWLKSK